MQYSQAVQGIVGTPDISSAIFANRAFSASVHNRGTVLLLSCCDNERTVPVYVPKS